MCVKDDLYQKVYRIQYSDIRQDRTVSSAYSIAKITTLFYCSNRHSLIQSTSSFGGTVTVQHLSICLPFVRVMKSPIGVRRYSSPLLLRGTPSDTSRTPYGALYLANPMVDWKKVGGQSWDVIIGHRLLSKVKEHAAYAEAILDIMTLKLPRY